MWPQKCFCQLTKGVACGQEQAAGCGRGDKRQHSCFMWKRDVICVDTAVRGPHINWIGGKIILLQRCLYLGLFLELDLSLKLKYHVAALSNGSIAFTCWTCVVLDHPEEKFDSDLMWTHVNISVKAGQGLCWPNACVPALFQLQKDKTRQYLI